MKRPRAYRLDEAAADVRFLMAALASAEADIQRLRVAVGVEAERAGLAELDSATRFRAVVELLVLASRSSDADLATFARPFLERALGARRPS